MNSLRHRLVTAFLLVLLVADAGVGVYGRIHKGRMHMLASEAAHVMVKMEAVLKSINPEVTGRLSDGDLSLEMYPNHDHLRLQNMEGVQEFGRLPADFSMLSASDRQILESMAASVANTGHAGRFFDKFPRFRESVRQRARAGWWKETKEAASNLGNNIYNGAADLGNRAVAGAKDLGNRAVDGFNNAVDGARNLANKIGDWTRNTYKSVEEGLADWRAGRDRCGAGAWAGQPDSDLYEIIGTPVSGVYRAGGNGYFKYDFAQRMWLGSNSEQGPWASVANYNGPAPAAAAIMNDRKPIPFGPPDAMDALGCPDPKTKSFMYDAGILATPLWFKFDAATKLWYWTPYPPGTGEWVPVSSLKAVGGQYNGQQPVEDNVDLIQIMDAYVTLGHVNPLPAKFGENVLKRGVRNAWDGAKKVWRAAFAPIVQKLKDLVNQVADTGRKLAQFKFSELGANLQKLGTVIAKAPLKFLGQLALNLIVGFFNGMLYGLLGHIGHTFHECEQALGAAFKNLVEKFKAAVGALCDLAKNFHINAIGAGFRKLFDAICDLLKALKDLIFGCAPLNKLLLMLVISVGVILLINAIAVATGYGAVVKVVLIFIDLVSATVYLVPTVLAVLNGIAALGTNLPEDKVADEFLKLIWNLSGIGGCITAVILTFKEMKHELPEAGEKLASSALGKRLGFSAREVGEGAAHAKQVSEATAAAKAGDATAAQKAGVTGMEKGPPKIETTPKPGQTPTTPVKPGQTPTTPVKPGQTPAKPGTNPAKPGETPAKPGEVPPTVPKEPPLLLPAPPKNAQEYKALLPAPKTKVEIPPTPNNRVIVVSPDGTAVIKNLDLAAEQVQLAKVAEEATSVAKIAEAPVVAPKVTVAGGKVTFVSRLKEAGFKMFGTLKDVLTGKKKLPDSVVLPFRKMKAQFAKLNNEKVWHTALHKTEEIVLWINQNKLAMELYEWAHHIWGHEEGGHHEAPHNDGTDIDNMEKEAAAHGVPTDAHPAPAPARPAGHH